jgi:hypothetical protein
VAANASCCWPDVLQFFPVCWLVLQTLAGQKYLAGRIMHTWMILKR